MKSFLKRFNALFFPLKKKCFKTQNKRKFNNKKKSAKIFKPYFFDFSKIIKNFKIFFIQFKQYRLMPALAACYAWRIFSKTFFYNLGEFLLGLMSRDKSDRQVQTNY